MKYAVKTSYYTRICNETKRNYAIETRDRVKTSYYTTISNKTKRNFAILPHGDTVSAAWFRHTPHARVCISARAPARICAHT